MNNRQKIQEDKLVTGTYKHAAVVLAIFAGYTALCLFLGHKLFK